MDFTGMMAPISTQDATEGGTPAKGRPGEDEVGRTTRGMRSGENSGDGDHHDIDVGARLNGMLSVVTGSHRALGDSDLDLNNTVPSSPKKRFSALLKGMSSMSSDTAKEQILAGQKSSSFIEDSGNGSGVLSSVGMSSNRAGRAKSNENEYGFGIRQSTDAARTQSTAPSGRSRSRSEDKCSDDLPTDGSETVVQWSDTTFFQKFKIVLRDGELGYCFHRSPHPFKPPHRPTTFNETKLHLRYDTTCSTTHNYYSMKHRLLVPPPTFLEPYGRFNQAIDSLIMVNMFALASESYGQGPLAVEVLTMASTVFTIGSLGIR